MPQCAPVPPIDAPRPVLATVLVARGMTKSFLGNTVLADVDVALRPGEVHGLVGENGAGKSTLMKLLAGVYQPDSGAIELDGREVTLRSPGPGAAGRASPRCSRSSTCCPSAPSPRTSTWAASRADFGLVDTGRMQRDTAELLTGLGIAHLKPGTLVRQLSVAEQQVVEIAKAVSFDAKVIQMDEPTAALADHEVELLYSIIERLTGRGVAILYVSHRLKEIFDLCQTITILKDGRQVSSGPASELTEASLVRQMVGRPLTSYFPDKIPGTEVGEVRLTLDGVGNPYVDGVDLTVRAGEIVGLAGLQGSGRTELVEAVFGVHAFDRGTMALDGKTVTRAQPAPGRPPPARAGHRGPQGQGPRPQPVDPRQRPRRGPRGAAVPHRRRAPRAARRAVEPRGRRRAASTRRCSSSPAATSRRSCSPAG